MPKPEKTGAIPIEISINENAKQSIIVIASTIVFVSLVILLIKLKKTP